MVQWKLLRDNKFFRQVLNLVSGSSFAQAITLLLSPLLTRLFSPSEFGHYFLYIISAGLLSIVTTGSLEKLIIILKSAVQANLVFSIVLWFQFAVFTLFILLYPLVAYLLDLVFNYSLLFSFYACALIYALLLATIRLFQALNNRSQNYKLIATTVFIKSFAIIAFQLLFGYFGISKYPLISGSILGLLSVVLFFIWRSPFSFRFLSFSEISTALNLIQKNKYFYLYQMPSEIINELSAQLPSYVFKLFFGQSYTGLFNLPQKVMMQPMNLLGRNVAEVFIRRASELEHQNRTQENLSFSIFKNLFLLGLIPFSILALFGPEIFSFIFGEEWRMSGTVAALLTPWLLFVLAASPISSVFMLKNKIRLSYHLNLILLLTRTGALAMGIFIFDSFIISVCLFSFVSTIYWTFLALYSLHLSGVRTKVPLVFMAKCLIIPFVLLMLRYKPVVW